MLKENEIILVGCPDKTKLRMQTFYALLFVNITQKMELLWLLMSVTVAQAGTNTGSCKDMLQGYLTGQLSSALGAYQVEAFRREFKSFTDVMEKSMKDFKENMESKVKTRRCI